jgi:Integrase core domain
MTGLLGRWPIWDIVYAIRGRQCPAAPRSAARAGAQVHDHLVGIHSHPLGAVGGTDFFTAEVLTLRGLVTYYVLFFIHLESRRVDIAGITVHPDEPWMKQIARNVTMEGWGALRDCRYLLHDRDTKFTRSFRAIIASGRVEPLALPVRSPDLNAYSERWVRSVNEECLSKVLLFGERSLRLALSEYVAHYHAERNHQGEGQRPAVVLVTRKRDEAGLCNVAKGWAGCCVIIIKKPRNLAEKPASNLR